MNSFHHSIPGRLWVMQLAETLSQRVDRIIKDWPNSQKDHLADQLIRATDSIGANISEGYARSHIKERLNFYSIAQGSLEEALFWVRRARDRELIPELEASTLAGLFIRLSKALDHFVESQKQAAGYR